MYELPYITITSELLIPHPGIEYTLPLPLDAEIKTQNLLLDDVEYKNLFVCILEDINVRICSLCVLENLSYTQKEQLLHFKSLTKVKLNKKNKKNAFVSFIEDKQLTKNNKTFLNNLITFISQSNDFKYLAKILPENEDPEILFSFFANTLYLQIPSSIKIYTLTDFKSKINIIYDALLTTSTALAYDLTPEGNKKSHYPEHVEQKLNQENLRLKNISQNSPEYSSTLDYIEILKNIPWNNYKDYKKDISCAANTLDNFHYGLKEIKDDFLDFLYLEKLTKVKTASCFLFDGPPGLGKTSFAKALAKALERDFVFISLAGVSDEAEIRGHRRTYTGSKPGRIISALKNIDSMNPIILLDEVDKISYHHGVNALESSLLELFDPQQSSQFLDRYLEIPVDLSKAIFICTSNYSKNISKPLLDRLQKITFKDYSLEEKIYIIENYTFPKLINDYSLNSYQLTLSEDFKIYLAQNCSLREATSLIAKCLRRKTKFLSTVKDTSLSVDLDFASNFITKKEKTRRIGFC